MCINQLVVHTYVVRIRCLRKYTLFGRLCMHVSMEIMEGSEEGYNGTTYLTSVQLYTL